MRIRTWFVTSFLCCGCQSHEQTQPPEAGPPIQAASEAIQMGTNQPIIASIERALRAVESQMNTDHGELALEASKSKNGWLIVLRLDPQSKEIHSEMLISVPNGPGNPYVLQGM